MIRKDVRSLIRMALREDAADEDITSRAVIPAGSRIRARIVAKVPGILAGGPVAIWTFHAVDPSLRCALTRREGAALAKGQTILTVEGRARSIFAAERTALNFLGHLSGIATLTHAFVQRAKPYRARILDTRKTLPGLRKMEKYAVRMGGGRNHRTDLAEAILIKTNHLKAMRRQRPDVEAGTLIQKAIRQAEAIKPMSFVEIEVTNIREFRQALREYPGAILLDNWPLRKIRKAVTMLNLERKKMFENIRPSLSTMNERIPRIIAYNCCLLEVSGGVTLSNVRAIARTGVDRISIGRLTHSAPSLDVSLQIT